jgi:hypothetical protein
MTQRLVPTLTAEQAALHALRGRIYAALAETPSFTQMIACSRGGGCQELRQEGWATEDTTLAGRPTLYVGWAGLAVEAPAQITRYAAALQQAGLDALTVVLLPDGRRVRYRPTDQEHAGLVPRLLIVSGG